MEKTSPFIFFLTLDDQLSNHYYSFDSIFKELGYVLVPVKVDQLQQLISSSEQGHIMVVSSVTSFKEYRLYNERVRNVLKYVLKSKRISFIHISSFSKLNDSRAYSLSKNYYFVKTPVDARILSEMMVRFHEDKILQSNLWPGGTRSMAVGSA